MSGISRQQRWSKTVGCYWACARPAACATRELVSVGNVQFGEVREELAVSPETGSMFVWLTTIHIHPLGVWVRVGVGDGVECQLLFFNASLPYW